MKLMRHFKTSEKGFTLVEVIVASALIGVASLALMNVTKVFNKGTSRSKAMIQISDIEHDILQAFTVANACNETLNQLNTPSDVELPIVPWLNNLDTNLSITDWENKPRLAEIKNFNGGVLYQMGAFYPIEIVNSLNAAPGIADSASEVGRTLELYDIFVDHVKLAGAKEENTDVTDLPSNDFAGKRTAMLRMVLSFGVLSEGYSLNAAGTPKPNDSMGYRAWAKKIHRVIDLPVIIEAGTGPTDNIVFDSCVDATTQVQEHAEKTLCMDLGGTMEYNSGELECKGVSGNLIQHTNHRLCQEFGGQVQRGVYKINSGDTNTRRWTKCLPVRNYDACNYNNLAGESDSRFIFKGFTVSGAPICVPERLNP